MKVSAILNNYQLGSYSYRVFNMNIIKEERVDDKHTKITWELEENQVKLLQRVLSKKINIEEK